MYIWREKIWQLFSAVNLGIYGGISLCFLMRFLNHHYTHNSDETTCAHLKRTPVTKKSPTMDCVKQTAWKLTWGKISTPSLSRKGHTRVCRTDWQREEASPLSPRNGGSKGDP
jgi:hypothetical protein